MLPPLLHLWSVWLLTRALATDGIKTERGRTLAFRAASVDFLVLCVTGAILWRLTAGR